MRHRVDPDRGGDSEAGDQPCVRVEEPASKPVRQERHADGFEQGGQDSRPDADRTGRPGGERDQPHPKGGLHEMRCSIREGGDQPMPVDENVPGHDREACVVVCQKQTRAPIETEDYRVDGGDEREPRPRPAHGTLPTMRRCHRLTEVFHD